MPWTAQEGVAHRERGRRRAGTINRENLRVEECIGAARAQPLRPAPGEGELDASRPGVRDVVGAKPADPCQRSADSDDQVVVSIGEDAGLRREGGRHDVRNADVETAAALRLERRIIGEGDLERVGRPDAGARAGAQPRTRHAAGILPREDGRRYSRIYGVHGLFSERRTRSEVVGVAFECFPLDRVHAHTGGQRYASAQLLPHFAESADRAALDRHRLETLAGEERAARPLRQSLDANRDAC
jgi:hypothetical protein